MKTRRLGIATVLSACIATVLLPSAALAKVQIQGPAACAKRCEVISYEFRVEGRGGRRAPRGLPSARVEGRGGVCVR